MPSAVEVQFCVVPAFPNREVKLEKIRTLRINREECGTHTFYSRGRSERVVRKAAGQHILRRPRSLSHPPGAFCDDGGGGGGGGLYCCCDWAAADRVNKPIRSTKEMANFSHRRFETTTAPIDKPPGSSSNFANWFR
jgi:hypothetical protein